MNRNTERERGGLVHCARAERSRSRGTGSMPIAMRGTEARVTQSGYSVSVQLQLQGRVDPDAMPRAQNRE